MNQKKGFECVINYMQIAIDEAYSAAQKGEVPVGALIVYQHKVIAWGANLVESTKNPLNHAEIVVIQKACQELQTSRLVECDLYVTMEPCPMCASAISHARIRRLYFGAFDVKGGGVDHGIQFFNHPTCFHRPEVYGGMREQDCRRMLTSFFIDKR